MTSPSLTREAVRDLARRGATQQAQQLATRVYSGANLAEIQVDFERLKPASPHRAFCAVFFHRATGGGIPAPLELSLDALGKVTQEQSELCARASQLAWRCMTDDHHVPTALPTLAAEKAAQWRADVEGRSAELALALAAMGEWCGVRPSQVVVATGKLSNSLEVERVQHTAEKIAGAVAELDGIRALFLVPPGANRPAVRSSLHCVKEVRTLAEAANAVWGEVPKPIPNDAVFARLAAAIDAAFGKRDWNGVSQLLERVDLEEVRKLHEGDWARLAYRKAAVLTHRGQTHAALALFEEAMPVASRLLEEGLLDYRERATLLEQLIVQLVARSDDFDREATTILEQAYREDSLGGLPLDETNRMKVRGTLAMFYSRLGEHQKALSLRNANVAVHEHGTHELRKEAAGTWSRLIWEAARAGDYELSRTAWENARACTADATQAAFNLYNWFRSLQSQAQSEEAIALLERENLSLLERSVLEWALKPESPVDYPVWTLRRLLGWALACKCETDRAAELFNAAAAKDVSGSPLLTFLRGGLFVERAIFRLLRGEDDLAKPEYEAAERCLMAHAAAARHYESLVVAVAERQGAAELRQELNRVYY